MYMDAADYSPEGVKSFPDGPGLPASGIQRGTLKDGLGDPSTYLYPSTSMLSQWEQFYPNPRPFMGNCIVKKYNQSIIMCNCEISSIIFELIQTFSLWRPP